MKPDVRILAFDPGTAQTGYSLLDGFLPSQQVMLSGFGMIRTKKVSGGVEEVRGRIDHIGQAARSLIEQYQPTRIAVEDFTEQGKFVGKTYKEMAWLVEHLRLTAKDVGLPVALYENGFWKKKLTRASRLNKAQIEHYIRHRLPEESQKLQKQPNHVWDSVGVALCDWDIYREGYEK